MLKKYCLIQHTVYDDVYSKCVYSDMSAIGYKLSLQSFCVDTISELAVLTVDKQQEVGALKHKFI